MHTGKIEDERILKISQKVTQAAKDTLGEKLEKVILYGSYARGDFDVDSDVDFFVLADVPQEDAGRWRDKINSLMPHIDLDFDILVSVKVTGSNIFHQYREALPFYVNILKDGVVLYE